MTLSLQTEIHKPFSGNTPKQIIVLLHGYGSNAQDLIGLAPYWERALPDAIFLSPNAPEPCEMAPVGYQWFSLMSDASGDLQVKDPSKYVPGVRGATPKLDQYLDEVLAEYGLADQDLALVGFSQGAMMSLHVGPRRKNKIAGILAYSGGVLDPEGLNEAHKVPIHLIHGAADEVVPPESFTRSKALLEENGFPFTGDLTEGLGHGIDNDGVENGARFLQGLFS